MELEVVVLAGGGTYFSPYFKETSPGQFNFTSDHFTIGNGPFEEIILESEESSDTICSVSRRGNSFVVQNDGNALYYIKVDGVTLKESQEIRTQEHSAVIVEIGSLSECHFKVKMRPCTVPDIPQKMHKTKVTAPLNLDFPGPSHCERGAFWICVNPSHNCQERRQVYAQVFPQSLVRGFIETSEIERQDELWLDFVKKYGENDDKWPGFESWKGFLKEYGEDSGKWPDAGSDSSGSLHPKCQVFEEQSERQVVKAMGKRQQQPQQEQHTQQKRNKHTQDE